MSIVWWLTLFCLILTITPILIIKMKTHIIIPLIISSGVMSLIICLMGQHKKDEGKHLKEKDYFGQAPDDCIRLKRGVCRLDLKPCRESCPLRKTKEEMEQQKETRI